MPVLCDLYCRVSTVEQASEGYSLQEQEARLRSYADAQGWVVHECYRDGGYSGAKLDRPGLQAVIRDVEAGRVAKVVTYKLDRLSRSQRDTLYLIEDVFLAHGVDYISMTESFNTSTAYGRAVLGLLSTFAQLEREQIAERMMMGRIASAREGNWRGGSGVPIGYRYLPKSGTEDGRLVVDPYEAAVVRKVFELFLQGKTYHAIYEFCRRNYTTSYGSFAGGGSALIPAMLSNRAYIGEIKYQGQWYPGKHEPIIDPETFHRAEAMMVEYRATLDAHRRKPFEAGHLLTGLLWCGECGARWCYHSCSYKTKAGERRTYGTYTCYTKNAHAAQRRAERCGIPVWPAEELEALVWDQVTALRYEDITEPQDADSIELAALEDKAAELDKQLRRVIDLYAIGTVPFDTIQAKAAEIEAERAKAITRADVLRRRSARPSAAEVMSALDRVEELRASEDTEAKRDLLRMLIRRVVLLPEREVRIEWNI